jgi:hypothetical protein
MLESVETTCADDAPASPIAPEIEREFAGLVARHSILPTTLEVKQLARFGHLVVIPVTTWLRPDFDPCALDDLAHQATAAEGGFALRIEGVEAAPDPAAAAIQIVTRLQRHLRARNVASATPLFDRLLWLHRGLHDLRKPLVAADYEHALDTWRWVLRLAPDASAAVQVAALFHDVERLVTESTKRVEQNAADYAAFKMAHAAAGGQITRRALRELGADAELVERAGALVATHEVPGDDPDKALLNEADALSFFSLNAPGFLNYYGRPHTETKVAYTLARLSTRGWAQLARIRHRDDVAEILTGVVARRGRGARDRHPPGLEAQP